MKYTYISNNRMIIPNYGEMYRYGETISTAFVESTINEVVAKRMVKKQQMQWSQQGAHYLLQTRTSVLNPKLCESGLFKGRSRLSKVGCTELRKALYMPALTSITHNPIIKSQWERLVKRNKGGKVGVCAAMRKLLQLALSALMIKDRKLLI